MKRFHPLFLLALLLTGALFNSAQAQSDQLPYLQKYPFNRLLTKQDLADTTAHDRRLMRNAIYARHGRPFTDANLAQFFGSQKWYRRDSSWKVGDEERRLSALEKRNIEFIARFEADLKNSSWVRNRLIKPGQSVGEVTLGMSRAKVLALWGQPTAMQKRPDKLSQDVWAFEDTHNRMALAAATVIYRAGKVAQIQVASHQIATADKISTANTLGHIRKTAKPLKRATYGFPVADGGLAIYDSASRGIAFVFYIDIEEEDDSSKPFEIIVHPAKRPIIPIAREAFGHGFQVSRLSR